ncbi:MAG TPA: DUF5995 family protein [Opitutaceae bacterium]
MGAGSIDGVLAELDGIIEVCRRRGTADGYFAALYRRVTAEVKVRIARGEFEDGARMERLDVVFANRYLDAWAARERGEPVTESWVVALTCCQSFWPVVLQHLLLGMNAHINLDLGIAAAAAAPGPGIHGLKNDFDTINAILAEMVDDVQDRLAQIWPAMRWLDRSGGPVDEAVVNFSMRRAREHAWSVAIALAGMQAPEAREAFICATDASMATLGRRVRHPGVKLSFILAFIRLRERGTVGEKIDALFR